MSDDSCLTLAGLVLEPFNTAHARICRNTTTPQSQTDEEKVTFSSVPAVPELEHLFFTSTDTTTLNNTQLAALETFV